MSGTSRRAGALAGVLLLLIIPRVPAVSGAQAGQAPTAAGAILLGRVIDADSGDPIGGARVWLRGGASVEPQEAYANGDGRVVFRDVAAGDYSLRATLAGYEPAELGQHRPGGQGRNLVVSSGRSVIDFTIGMWRYASIAGTVTDDAGEPAVGVEVKALRVVMAGGEAALESVTSLGGLSVTDDRGVYRIANLRPGRYFVLVPSVVDAVPTSTASRFARAAEEMRPGLRESSAPSPSSDGIRVGEHIVSMAVLSTAMDPVVSPDGRLHVYPTVFHPASRTLEEAGAVALTSGEQRGGVDVQLTRTPASRVSGDVIGPDGPAAYMGVRLLMTDAARANRDSDFEVSTTMTDGEGRFTLVGVPSGRYLVEFLRVPQATAAPRTTTAIVSTGRGRTIMSSAANPEIEDAPNEAATLWAERQVTVADADVDGVLLTLAEGARLTGRLEFDGDAPDAEALMRFAVQLRPVSGRDNPLFLRPPPVSAAGTFSTLAFPPGRYFIGLTAGARWRVKSVTLNGRDLTDVPLELEDDDVNGVVLTLSARLSELSGSVAPRPDGDATAVVAVFPADHAAWIDNGMSPARTGTATTAADGQFAVTGLRAGSYLAVALPADADIDLQDPAVIEKLVSLATLVRLPEDGTATTTLQLRAYR